MLEIGITSRNEDDDEEEEEGIGTAKYTASVQFVCQSVTKRKQKKCTPKFTIQIFRSEISSISMLLRMKSF